MNPTQQHQITQEEQDRIDHARRYPHPDPDPSDWLTGILILITIPLTIWEWVLGASFAIVFYLFFKDSLLPNITDFVLRTFS